MTTQTDVFALGITIAEVGVTFIWLNFRDSRQLPKILTRKRPYYDRNTVGLIVLAITKGERPSVDDVEEAAAPPCWRDLWDLACACWAQNPDDRPTMTQVIERLEALGDNSTPNIPDITSEIYKEPTLKRRGGFCEVYLGRHRQIGMVALRLPSVEKRGDADQRVSYTKLEAHSVISSNHIRGSGGRWTYF